jgi:hypothetical protein
MVLLGFASGGLLEQLDLDDAGAFLELPLDADAALEWSVLDLFHHLPVRTAAVLGESARPVRHVAPPLLFPIGGDLDPVRSLRGDDAGDRALSRFIFLVLCGGSETTECERCQSGECGSSDHDGTSRVVVGQTGGPSYFRNM